MEEKAFLEEEYGIVIHGMREEGAARVLETDQGLFYLYDAPANFRYKGKLVERIRQQLAQQTEIGLLKLVRNREGLRHVTQDEQMFYLYRGVREAEPEDYPFACGQTLAAFHQATAAIPREKLLFSFSSLGNWPGMWGRRLRQYDYCLDELEKAWTELTAMDHYLLTSYTYVHQLGETALRYLHEAGYEQMVRQTAQFGRVAFQSFGQGYFRWNEQMRPLLGGEWNWVLDMRARDIGQWLKAESRRNGWRDEEAIRFLDGYNSVSPLLEREYAVIYALLLYPGRFLKLVETYQQLPPEERQEVDGEAWQAQLEAEMERMEVALRRYPQAIMQQYGVSIPQIDWLWRYEDEKTESAGNEKNRG